MLERFTNGSYRYSSRANEVPHGTDDGLSVAAVTPKSSANGIRCYNCHQTDHISRKCHQRQVMCTIAANLFILLVTVDSSHRKIISRCCEGSSTSRPLLKLQEYITAAMTDKVTIVDRKLEENFVCIILDSG